MNTIKILKEKHKNITALISELRHEVKELESTEQDVVDCERTKIFGNLRDAITQYADIEERFFYPALTEFVETRTLLSEAYPAHRRIRELVGRMEKLRLAEQCDRWDDDLEQLRQSLRRHFAWEEHKLFPEATRILGEGRLEQMSRQIGRVLRRQSESDNVNRAPRRSVIEL